MQINRKPYVVNIKRVSPATRPIPHLVQQSIQAVKPPNGREPVERLFHKRALAAVGPQIREDTKITLQRNLANGGYPISNGVGVGIHSYNNIIGLQHTIKSIRRHTDLQRTTIFISDDGSTDYKLITYLAELESSYDFTVLYNQPTIGKNGNVARLLACLARFERYLVLDSADVVNAGWDHPGKCKCWGSDDIEVPVGVPAVSYVVPVRDIGRAGAVGTVINGLRAQRFPIINIIVVEQDDVSRLDVGALGSVVYRRVGGEVLFNKALAFNTGVSNAKTEGVILHDADILAPAWYTSKMVGVLGGFDSCHMGRRVIYTSRSGSDMVLGSGRVAVNTMFERAFGYHEGGSVGCRVDIYWRIGGFNEDFKGYGNEDWDFFYRLANGSRLFNERCADFVHLWHERANKGSDWLCNVQLELANRELPFNEYMQAQAARVTKYIGQYGEDMALAIRR